MFNINDIVIYKGPYKRLVNRIGKVVHIIGWVDSSYMVDFGDTGLDSCLISGEDLELLYDPG